MKKKIKPKKKGPSTENLTADEALALAHTPGADLHEEAGPVDPGRLPAHPGRPARQSGTITISSPSPPSPHFQAYLRQLETDYFNALDQKIKNTLDLGVNALIRQLRNNDWRARDAAVEKLFRLQGRYIDRVDLRGSLNYTGQMRRRRHRGRTRGIAGRRSRTTPVAPRSI
jgi:hypothetical protein